MKNYLPYFERVAKFLRAKAIGCELIEGRRLSESDIADFSHSLGIKIPSDLADYLGELGDGFGIQWTDPSSGELIHFGLSFLEDIQSEFHWIQQQLRDLHSGADGELSTEAELRMGWLPIMGIGEGGSEFCLETRQEPAPVRYYESFWKSNRAPWNSSIATSLGELIQRWSRYCFSPPTIRGRYVSMVIIAAGLNGPFNWAPSHFSPEFDLEG